MLRATRPLKTMMARMVGAPPCSPLIAVVGATGTGKSGVRMESGPRRAEAHHHRQLAVDLALSFNGEIINGDAMQMYKGLPIITNKITLEEQRGVTHHLLGCVGLGESPWTVTKFVRRALEVIEDIHHRGKLPILVGGTHYYIQSLLFRDVLADQKGPHITHKEDGKDSSNSWPILEAPTEVILAELRKIDPVMAERWHPHDHRKIRRSLEIWHQTGKKASDLYQDQHLRKHFQESAQSSSALQTKSAEDAINCKADVPSGMRFPTLLFWVHTPRNILLDRLRARIDNMMQIGLVEEIQSLESFARMEEASGRTIDQSRGIWVSVGYKEFHSLLQALNSGVDDPTRLDELKQEGIELTKIATWKYSKSQMKWIRIKLVNALRTQNAEGSMFVIDTSDHSDWQHVVLEPALRYTNIFLHGQTLPDPRVESESARELLNPRQDYDLSHRRDLWKQQTCQACNVTAVTEKDWDQHVQSNRHRKLVKKRQDPDRSRWRCCREKIAMTSSNVVQLEEAG